MTYQYKKIGVHMFVIRKEFKFEMSHQLEKAYSASCTDCIHGHSYVCELFLTAKELDDSGMVIDFGLVKRYLEDYIQTWDHALVLPKALYSKYTVYKPFRLGNTKIIKTDYNPTAEEMSRDMFNYIKKVLKAHSPQIAVKAVRLHETKSGWAEYSEE